MLYEHYTANVPAGLHRMTSAEHISTIIQHMLISDISDWAINMDYMGVNRAKPAKIMFGLSFNGKRSI